MKIKRCPDCSTGWRYADDLPSKHQHHHDHHHGLVPCPTCHGQGRIIVAEAAPVQFAQEAEKRRVAAARVDVRRPQYGADYEITLAYA